MDSKQLVASLLAHAQITVNGKQPYDIQVHNDKFYDRVLAEGSLGLGESYMDGWWDCEQLDEFFNKVVSAQLHKKTRLNVRTLVYYAVSKLLNMQSKSRAFIVGEKHYDKGNDLFEAMLDKRMVYTCAYWKNARTLDAAQEAKLDLVCKKIGLKKGMRVLDIGCGWGSFAKYAAEKYGAHVVGITVSKEQLELAQVCCRGLPVEIRLQDYRDVNEKFDRIISLGMFEHVGHKNYRTYFEVANRCLKEDGLFLLHTIGKNHTVHATDPWIAKYIFPNGHLPSVKQIGRAIERLFVMEDWHNFGADYDRTLMAWHANVSKNWKKLRYDERFQRMWRYYLLSCAGAFRARDIQLWQIVLSKNGVPGGYISVR